MYRYRFGSDRSPIRSPVFPGSLYPRRARDVVTPAAMIPFTKISMDLDVNRESERKDHLRDEAEGFDSIF